MVLEADCRPKKFKITERGLVFLEKYWELQYILGANGKQIPIMLTVPLR